MSRRVDSRSRGNDGMRGVLWDAAGGHRDPPLRFWVGDKFSGNDGMRDVWIPAFAGMTR